MKKYEDPTLEVIYFNAEDVIATSGGDENDEEDD